MRTPFTNSDANSTAPPHWPPFRGAKDEVSGHVETARKACRPATEYWPVEPAAWLSRGNSLNANGQFDRSVAAFRQAAALAPADPRAWNNPACALPETVCRARAVEVAACAVSLSPDNPEYLDNRAEVTQRVEGAVLPPAQCTPLQRVAAPGSTGQ